MKQMNLIGRQVGRLRYQRGWTQDTLAAKLQLAGWMITRSSISKIESGLTHVYDFRASYFAHVFGVEIAALFPKIDLRLGIHKTLLQFIDVEPRHNDCDLMAKSVVSLTASKTASSGVMTE